MTDAIASRPSGLDLQFRRKGASLTQQQLADEMGVARARISAIEAARHPSPAAIKRYLAALAALDQPPLDEGELDLSTAIAIYAPLADRVAKIEQPAR